MNPLQRPYRSLANSQPIGLAFLLALLTLMGMTQRSIAQMSMDEISLTFWKLNYGVTDAQIASSVWLAADVDGDGISSDAERTAGTNPFTAASVLKVITVTRDADSVQLTYPTLKGKNYVVQTSPTLAPASWTSVAPLSGITAAQTASVTRDILLTAGPGPFYRVLVQDVDTDGDGASDWAEVTAGYDPNDNADGGGGVLSGEIANSGVVTVSVTRSSATQPLGLAAPVETGSITVSRSGTLKFYSITVPLQISGTAIAGTDYDALASPVTFPAGAGEVVLTVNPKANSARTTNVTATVKALAGVNYALGAAISGSVVINPAGVANGTGLSANYQNTSSSVYATQQTIFAGTQEMTRTDAVVDFGSAALAPTPMIASIAVGNPCVVTTTRATALTSGDSITIAGVTLGTFSPAINGIHVVTMTSASTFTIPVNCTVVPTAVTGATITPAVNANGWGAAIGGPRGMTPSLSTAFSVRWTGQILPKFSETYSIDLRSDESAKVWVNGQLLIDRWTTQGATDYVNTIPLQAGIRYDIQIDYWNNTGGAEARLYWWSASQVREIIPQSRLFPAPAQAGKATAITSSIAAVGYEGVPFNFSVTSSDIGGAGTTYALVADGGPLPNGLTLNTTTGAITGTPSTSPASRGTYNVAVNAINEAAAAVMGSSIVDITIYPVGAVTREILTASGPNVSDIVIPSPTVTPAHDTIATMDDDDDHGTNKGERLRGYLVPPKTGNYYFWIAANNAAELWISTDAEYVNRVRYASLGASSGKKTWNASPTQRTPWLSLVAGEKYYIEALHNTGADADAYVAVGWCQDDIGTVPSTVTAPNPTGLLTLIPNDPTSLGTKLQGYPLSGTVPSYIFQPYDYPVVTPPSGTLYAGNLGPQANAITSASGSANIQVNAAETQAILHFAYQNLGTPKTAYHLHVDGFVGADSVTHPQGEIIFDIDDADQNPLEQTGDGGYIWTFNPVGSFSTVTQIREALHKGKVYLNIHSVGYPNGEIRGTFGLIDGSQTTPEPYPEPTATDVASDPANAARFLNQATFGASPTEVAAVGASGFQGWINGQLTQPASHTSNDVVAGLSTDVNTPYPSALFTNSWWNKTITGPDQLRQRLAFALSEVMVVSWANNTGPLQNNGRILADYFDQLVDYCLPTAGLADSGNFRGILKAVTLTPAMGLYLDMRANQKGDDTIGRHPNENYGRELMQLFSVGIYRMWDDGRFVLGSDAGLVSTYSQPTIIGLSNLLTGWNYAQPNQANGRAPSNFGPAVDYLNPMVLVPTRHELASKLLLNNVVSPAATGRTPRVVLGSVTVASPCVVNTSTIHGLKAGDTVTIVNVAGGAFSAPINAAHQVTEIVDADSFKVGIDCTGAPTAYTNATVTGATVTPSAIAGTGGITAVTGSQADNAGVTLPHPYDEYGLVELERAIDNIVNNDNVPPYICRQLIQRLVTSDPSPGYIYRVVQKFKNNGSGVRGDLAAVVSQILLDGEARRSSVTNSNDPGGVDNKKFGKQREPILRLTGPARAFPAVNYTGTYTQLTGVNSNRLRITTSAPNDFNSGFTVSLDFKGNYTATSPPDPYTNPTSTSYGINSTLGIASATVGNPCTVTTVQNHGLTTGNSVTISGVSGGSFSPTINGTFDVTVASPTSFTVASNCTAASTINTGSIVGANTLDVTATGMSNVTYVQPAGNNLLTVNTGGPPTNIVVPGTTVNITAIALGSPCTVTTGAAHNLVTGGLVTIAGVTDGTFTTAITGTFVPEVLDATTFTVPVECTLAPLIYTPGMTNTTKRIRSRVYLAFLTQTTAGGAVIPPDGAFDVQTNPTTGSFTITTAVTPVTGRGGNVLLPKLTTSYTLLSSNTIVQYNNNVNHNMLVGQNVWVDVPVVGSPVADAEYTITETADEDHFKTSKTPANTHGGTYPTPVNANNGITIYPLVPPPLGRSGSVVINQSTFNLNSTEASLTQSPLNAPTVFNYFFPDYKFPGSLANSGLDSPEFQLTTDTNVMNLTNSMTNMFIGVGGSNGNLNGLSSFNNGGGSVVMDIGSYMTAGKTANAGIPALIDELASLLVGAPLVPDTKTKIQSFVANTSNFPYTTPTNLQMRDRVRAIIHLIITSAEYAVQK